jgi:DNA-binding NtrC family response regulator
MAEIAVKVGMSLAEIEKRAILATLKHLSGNKRQTAILLKIDQKTLHNRLREYAGKERYA